jgi:hypothetical protein
VARGGLYAKLQIQLIRYANQFYQLFMQIWPRARRVITFLTDPMIGSCMIAAPPGVPVFIDTRFGFCGSDFSTETLDALAVQPDWKNFLDRYAINIAVLDRSRPLAQAFAVDSRFSLLYGNDEAVVVRRLP